MTRSVEARRHSRQLWAPLIGAVPFLASCVFIVCAVRDLHTSNDDLSGLLLLGAIALAVLGLFILIFNVLATRSRPTPAFIGGLGSIGASVLLMSAVQQTDAGWAAVVTLVWAIANAGAVLYALGGGPVRPQQRGHV